MANTVIDAQNKLIKFTQDINREFVRENMFSPYMGEEMNAIIRIRSELKSGGEVINLPTVRRLKTGIVGGVGNVVRTGTLVGAEEVIDNYGQRVRVDWARNAVVTNKAENQKDSADIFGEAKPLLSDWGKELQRDDVIRAMMSILSVTLPTNTTVNGIEYQTATPTQRGQWQLDNADRVLFGATKSNRVAVAVATDHAASLANLDTTADKLGAASLSLMKRIAMTANPHIRPYKTRSGYEYFVAFAGASTFRDLKLDPTIVSANTNARAREGREINGGPDNPLFQDGDILWDGVIVRLVPDLTQFSQTVWTTLPTAGAGGTVPVEPVFLCGQQAVTLCWGQMAKPTFLKEDDYGFKQGVGIEMCFGTAKIFSAPVNTATPLTQLGMVTGFFAAAGDT
jgi:Protein of unknown function (DUF4043)